MPLVLAPPTAKGRKGRSTWIDYDDLARVHDYIGWERAAAAEGSWWRPRDPLFVEAPTHDGALINGTRRRWHSLTPAERLRLVAPGGGSALLAVQAGGKPFVDWATVLRRTVQRIRDRFVPSFPHVHPHVTRHTIECRRAPSAWRLVAVTEKLIWDQWAQRVYLTWLARDIRYAQVALLEIRTRAGQTPPDPLVWIPLETFLMFSAKVSKMLKPVGLDRPGGH
ncbi:hypothetical protein [Streptomyces griseochromogenes]|uniref:hypothetical protein n=1 Tax=Streptomyces griseochromogenes TaxID=68214 RepID=UPI00379F863C